MQVSVVGVKVMVWVEPADSAALKIVCAAPPDFGKIETEFSAWSDLLLSLIVIEVPQAVVGTNRSAGTKTSLAKVQTSLFMVEHLNS